MRGSGFAPNCSCTGARLAQPTHDGGDAQPPRGSYPLAQHQYRNEVPQHHHRDLPSSKAVCHSSVLSNQHSWGCVKCGTKRHTPSVNLSERPLRNPEEGQQSVRLSTSRRQRPRHGGEVCCEPAADALAPPRRVSAPISNRIVDRAEVELRVRFQWSAGRAGWRSMAHLWHTRVEKVVHQCQPASTNHARISGSPTF